MSPPSVTVTRQHTAACLLRLQDLSSSYQIRSITHAQGAQIKFKLPQRMTKQGTPKKVVERTSKLPNNHGSGNLPGKCCESIAEMAKVEIHLMEIKKIRTVQ